ncbi:helix-turn-helix domain-containing protein [Kribbella capetownensis]|uniref:helix-turn-helix domain-containing protein n=1 Tax=Kribbella capetownensis TaxID=1572659 RepID=UPI00192DF45B|nr:helix-turn-helix domain-containing protein [Kribbella capetownensis]
MIGDRAGGLKSQTPAEVALRYGVHRAWVYQLKARYLAKGAAAFEPRSRRPKTSPRATPPATVELVLALREQLAEQGPGCRCGHDRLAPGAPPPPDHEY